MFEGMLQAMGLSGLKTLAKRLGIRLVIGIVPIALGTLTIVLGAVGWSVKLFDGSFHSSAEIAFRTLGDLAPSLKNLENGNSVTDLAALSGLLTLYSSLIAILASLFREQRRKLLARYVHRGHQLVIGTTPLATRAAALWQQANPHTLQVAAGGERPAFRRHLVRHALDDSLFASFAFSRAARILFDLGDDAETMRLGLLFFSALVARCENGAKGAPPDSEWIFVLQKTEYAEHFAARARDMRAAASQRGGLPAIFVLRPERLLARQVLLNAPPFLEGGEVQRTHILIVGFDLLGEQLMEGLYQIAPVADRPAPIATILTRDPVAARTRFFGTRPDLAETIDVTFLDAGALDDFQTRATRDGDALRARDATDPITAVYLTGAQLDDKLGAAMLIQAIRRRTGRLSCRLFLRADSPGATASSRQGVFGSSATGEVTEFELSDEFLRTQITKPAERDLLARALHEQYVLDRGTASDAALQWDALPEDLRIANCNAADHCLAKMHSFGFDVSGLPPGILPRLDAAHARELLEQSATAPSLAPVLRLEHERWACERRFGGWTYGERRDDCAQRHPFLVPWKELLERFSGEAKKDLGQLQGLIRCMERAGDPDHVLRKRAAVAAVSTADPMHEAVEVA